MFNFGPSPDVMNRYLPPGIGSAQPGVQGLPGMGMPMPQPQTIDVGASMDPRMPNIGGNNGMMSPMMPPPNMMRPEHPAINPGVGMMTGGTEPRPMMAPHMRKPLGQQQPNQGIMQRFAGMNANPSFKR